MTKRELQDYLYDIVQGKSKGIGSASIRLFLHGLSFLYCALVSISLNLYRFGLLRTEYLPCKVISLGNITVGGTGKTPTAQALAVAIRDAGYKVAILNRGYRAKSKETVGVVSDGKKIHMTAEEAGDEAYLLAKSLPDVPVLIGKRRDVTGRYAVKKFGVDVVILDDGYQHWRLHRDIDIVLVDVTNTFGNNYVLPRGTLREPLKNLRRADAFLLTKVDQTDCAAKEKLKSFLRNINSRAVITESIHDPKYLYHLAQWFNRGAESIQGTPDIKGRQLLTFCGIGNPKSFENTLMSMGAICTSSIRYPDHHQYTLEDMHHIMQQALTHRVDYIVTTEKDAVKIPPGFIRDVDLPVPMLILGIEVKMTVGRDELIQFIHNAVKKINRNAEIENRESGIGSRESGFGIRK
jgi:tetraacyldisaccharide 4'-kinase